MQKRAALYLRVSTNEQTTENQRLELARVAERSGWNIAAVYEDKGVSGAKGRDERLEFNRMLEDANRRKFDIVAAWSVDRLGRSLHDLLGSSMNCTSSAWIYTCTSRPSTRPLPRAGRCSACAGCLRSLRGH